MKIADVFSKFFQRKSFSSNVFSSSIIDDLKLIMAAQGMQGVCQDTTGIIESIDEKNMTVTVRKNSEGCRYYIPHLILFPRDNKLRGFYRVLHILFNELIVKKNVEVPREILADAA